MSKEMLISGSLCFVLVVVVIIILSMITKEDYINVASEVFNQNIATGGKTTKQMYNKKFHYVLAYNLPITNPPFQMVDSGKNFNSTFTRKHYKVYMGKDKKNMVNVGTLQRFSDGYHKLEINSNEDYDYVCVTLGDEVVDCSSVESV